MRQSLLGRVQWLPFLFRRSDRILYADFGRRPLGSQMVFPDFPMGDGGLWPSSWLDASLSSICDYEIPRRGHVRSKHVSSERQLRDTLKKSGTFYYRWYCCSY